MCIRLVPTDAVVITELTLLLYSDYGARVATLDLRKYGMNQIRLERDPYDFEVRVESLPLVEGDYHLGFYIATNGSGRDYLDVATLTVTAPERNTGFVPYAPQYRGVLELDFMVNTQHPGATRSLSL